MAAEAAATVLLILLVVAAAALILASSEAFINGVEWLAFRWRLGPAGTGAVLAALGGTLPETLVTVLAAADGAHGVSTGTALGSPALLATLAFGLVAWTAKRSARSAGTWDGAGLGVRSNLAWFAVLFSAAVALALLPPVWPKSLFAAAFGLAWLLFCVRTWDRDRPGGPPPRRLYLSATAFPALGPVLFQTAVACAGLAVGSDLLVDLLERVSVAWQVPSLIVSLTLAPLATELPEMATSALWAARGRLDLALQNVSGALVMSATLPVAASLLFNPWRLTPPAVVAVLASFAGAAVAAAGCAPRARPGPLVLCGFLFALYMALLYA